MSRCSFARLPSSSRWPSRLASRGPPPRRARPRPGSGPPAPAVVTPEDLAFFENKVRPILVDRCYKCHSLDADKPKGGLMLDTQEGLIHGGDTGPAIEPGNLGESLLIQAVKYTDENLQMPPKGDKLSDQQVNDLTEWVRRGAPDPRNGVEKGSSLAYGGVGRQHWSFLPLQLQPVPAVSNQAWVRNPIDNFVLAAGGERDEAQSRRRTSARSSGASPST